MHHKRRRIYMWTMLVWRIKPLNVVCGVLLVLLLHRYLCDLKDFNKAPLDREVSDEESMKIQQWLQRRKEAQASSPHKKVLLFAYMRGGSTILSETFAKNPDVFFWYEPLDQFYSSILGSYYHFPISHALFLPTYTLRPIPQWESDLLAEYIHNMYTCRLRDLPIETLTHYKTYWGTSFRTLHQCMKKRNVTQLVSEDCKLLISHCYGNVVTALKNNCTSYIQHYNKLQGLAWPNPPVGDTGKKWNKNEYLGQKFQQHAECLDGFKTSLEPCLDAITSECNIKPIHVSKILKLTMDSVDEVLERLPDLSLIYFVRDPRGTATSRKDSGITFSESDGAMVPEAHIICQKMRNDLALYRRLRTRYPGAMTLLRYEDLVLDLRGTLHKIYEHFGEDVPRGVYDTVYDMMHAKKNIHDDDMFAVRRSDAKKSLYKWLTKNSQEEIEGMTKHCSDILDALGYPYQMTIDQEYPPFRAL